MLSQNKLCPLYFQCVFKCVYTQKNAFRTRLRTHLEYILYKSVLYCRFKTRTVLIFFRLFFCNCLFIPQSIRNNNILRLYNTTVGAELKESVGMFLRQIVIQRGIPFEMKLPAKRPLTLDELTKEQFDAELLKGIDDIENERVFSADDVEAEMRRMYTKG